MFLSKYKNKRVLVTGHTGFKGSWLTFWLLRLGAKVCGYSIDIPTQPSLFESLDIKNNIEHNFGDILDIDSLNSVFEKFKPEIVFHLAAQPIVKKSFKDPIETYSTNVIGTLNVLEAIKITPSVKSSVMITTDKCYKNKEWVWGYRENDELGGHDPYSSSKACAEILIKSYCNSFFNSNNDRTINVASARAGNVIGGGDWAEDRLIPDIFNSLNNNQKIILRNPLSIRPWQHVLDSLNGYIILAKKLFENQNDFKGSWNFGPNNIDTKTVIDIVNYIELKTKNKLDYELKNFEEYKESNFLKLDSTKSINNLKWNPIWDINESLDKTIEWYINYNKKSDMSIVSNNQIDEFINSYYKRN